MNFHRNIYIWNFFLCYLLLLIPLSYPLISPISFSPIFKYSSLRCASNTDISRRTNIDNFIQRDIFPSIDLYDNEFKDLIVYFLNGNPLKLTNEQKRAFNEIWEEVQHLKVYTVSSLEDKGKLLDSLLYNCFSLTNKDTLPSVLKYLFNIAAILDELSAPLDVILAAFLNRIINIIDLTDNNHIQNCLEEKFNSDVLKISRAFNSLQNIGMFKQSTMNYANAENQIQLFIISANDYRALYLLLAERLQLIRFANTSFSFPRDSKFFLAEETLQVFSPLAHRMGLMNIRSELEDTSFSILQPQEFFMLSCYHEIAIKVYNEALEKVQFILLSDPIIKQNQIHVRVNHRFKGKYQIYQKLLRKHYLTPSLISDALGFRLILSSYPLLNETLQGHRDRMNSYCYHFLERIRNLESFSPIPNGLDDYIKYPKLNGYQSLHQEMKHNLTSIHLEFQIRTSEMHGQAELGEAAHWYYKDLKYKASLANSYIYQLAWRSLNQYHAKSSAEIIGLAKKQVMDGRVLICFENNLKILNLKKGSTSLDLSYYADKDSFIYTQEALVNHQSVSMSYKLKNQDKICLIYNSSVQVTSNWLHFTSSFPTQAFLRKFLKKTSPSHLVCLGILHYIFFVTINKDKLNHLLNIEDFFVELFQKTTITPVQFMQFLGSFSSEVILEKYLRNLFENSEIILQPLSQTISLANSENSNLFDKEILDNILFPLICTYVPVSLSLEWKDLLSEKSFLLKSINQLLSENQRSNKYC